MKGKIWLCVLLFAALASIPFLVPHCGWVALFAFIPLLRFADLCTEGPVTRKGWMLYLAFLLFNTATTFWINWISIPGAFTAIALNSLHVDGMGEDISGRGDFVALAHPGQLAGH